MQRWMFWPIIAIFANVSDAREWIDATGSFSIQAEFVSLENETVTLRKPDNSTIELPLVKLSENDQFVAQFMDQGGQTILAKIVSDDQYVRHDAAKKLLKMNLPANVVEPILKFIEHEVAEIDPQNNQPGKGKKLKSVPIAGDETPLVRLKADPQRYLDRKIIIVGAVSPSSYYNYGYNRAEKTHYSLRFVEVDEQLTTGEDAKSLWKSNVR